MHQRAAKDLRNGSMAGLSDHICCGSPTGIHGFFIILLGPVAGGLIAEIARFVTRRRRSKRLYILAAVAAVIGCIPLTLQIILRFSLLGLIWQAAYAVLMTSALYTRLAGIKIG
jgi:hypothetical protein